MENTNPNGSQKPNMKMIGIIIVAVILVALIIVLISRSKNGVNNISNNSNVGADNTPAADQVASEKTPEVALTTTATGQVIPVGSHVEIAGANPVKDNVVVTQSGEAVKNDVVPMSPEAPQQTAPVTKESVPASAKKIDVSAAGFLPSSFEVKAGSVVTLSVTSVDSSTHVFMFDDASLAAVAIGVGPSETRAITFNAPTKAGEYSFRCDVPGHSGRGETGKMIVK